MTKKDKVIIFSLILISITCYLLFLLNSKQVTSIGAEILVDGEIFAVVEFNQLDTSHLIDVTGPLGISIVEIKKDKVRMLSSPCPDHICMEMGWITEPGQVITCVPNRIIIKITSNKNMLDSIIH